MRLQKWMAQAGIASRRECEKWISSGDVKVNGKLAVLGMNVNPEKDIVEVKGQKIVSEHKRVFLFYKPRKVITSMTDPEGRKVVADFFRRVKERVYPVGRLDYETEGLLLMTNDGELSHQLMHPKYRIKKTYMAIVKGMPTRRSLMKLEKGIKLSDGMTAPSVVRAIHLHSKKSKVEITIHEGRNRQVRRMFEEIGYPVVHLMRTHYHFLTLKGLKSGEYRELTLSEVNRLKGRGK